MLSHIHLENLLFIDIETVSSAATFSKLSSKMKELWEKKQATLLRAQDLSIEEGYKSFAGIYAEFGKIICISCGFLSNGTFRLKSFYGTKEIDLLTEFSNSIKQSHRILCGHNIKEFDIPYLCRRMLINHIELPSIIDISGKKPWEVNYIDTLQLWKFGDYKAYTSLDLLASLFNIPSPKDAIDGSLVGTYFWEKKKLKDIVTYCQKDVVCVLRLLQKWKGVAQIKDKHIIHLE